MSSSATTTALEEAGKRGTWLASRALHSTGRTVGAIRSIRDLGLTQLKSEYFRAGAGVLAAGAAAHVVSRMFNLLWNGVEESVSVTAEFSSRDEVYVWLLQWLGDQPAI